MATLEELRAEIDSIDTAIIDLIGRGPDCAGEVRRAPPDPGRGAAAGRPRTGLRTRSRTRRGRDGRAPDLRAVDRDERGAAARVHGGGEPPLDQALHVLDDSPLGLEPSVLLVVGLDH